MPSDIVGTEVIHENRETGERGFRFMPGPIFANLVLADEINRTPPKTQAALLEAMQERSVTVAGVRHDLEDPFFVLATQNPIEQEGTYPLPEAQLDRFMLQIQVDYPSEEEELRIALETTSGETRTVSPVLHGSDIVELRRIVRRMPVSPRTAQFAVRLARMSRPTEPGADDFVKKYVLWGAGPRASQYLLLGAKARAALKGSRHVRLEDVQAVAAPALRHRIRTNFHADAEGVGVEAVIERLLQIASAAPSRDDHVAEVFRPADARANP
jgi:MoxR-like ATPase